MTIDGVADGHVLDRLPGSVWGVVVLEKDCFCRLCGGKISAGKPLLVFRGNEDMIYRHKEDCSLVTLGG